MKRSVVTLLLGVFLLVIACQPQVPGGEQPLDTLAAVELVSSGVQGVELEFLQDLPPPVIYDQNELVSLIEVRNLGNSNLAQEDCFVHITGFDPFIIAGGFDAIRPCAENLPLLEGKSLYNTQGEVNQLEFISSAISLPDVPEYSPNLKYNVCYNYHTKASPSVCVDPLKFQVSGQQKACDFRSGVKVRAGQGGPVGISYVKSDMVNGKAIFEINVRNMGNGRILSPYADIFSCGDVGLDRTEFDRVGYTVQLGGGALGDCKPRDGIIRMNNENGKILCTFDTFGTAAYETPLIVDLDYSYWQSYDKQVRIVKTPE
tara:strand:- start:9247 stop:10194 length:948 start_codon:yes stop_codon:yes gene_type:complete